MEEERRQRGVVEEEVSALRNALVAVREEKRIELSDMERVVLELQRNLEELQTENARLKADKSKSYSQRSRYQFEESEPS